MQKHLYADIFVRPVSFPDKFEVIYAEVDKSTGQRINSYYKENDLYSLQQLKDRLLVPVYAWPGHEEKLKRGEDVPVARGPVSFDLNEPSSGKQPQPSPPAQTDC